MDESKVSVRLFREGRNRMYQWVQKWMGRVGNEEPVEQGVADPVDVAHIVNLLRAGLGFRLRHVDQPPAQAMALGEDSVGCRVVVSCATSGLRAVLELPQPQGACCCRPASSDTEANFWSVSSSSESIFEAGCSSLPELNQGLSIVVKDVLSQLHHVMIQLNNPLARREIAAKLMTTGSLQSLTPSPGLEKMRRVSSSPILSKESGSLWSHQSPSVQPKREDSTVSLQEFPSIASTDISPIQGSVSKSVPSFRTSSPHSVRSSLEKLSIKSNSNIIERLEDIAKELDQVISLAKGSSPNVTDRRRKLSTVTESTSNATRKKPVAREIPSSVRGTPQRKALQAPRMLSRDRTVTIKTDASVKKLFSGSKLRTPQTETSASPKSIPIIAKRRINTQSALPKLDTKVKGSQKKPAK